MASKVASYGGESRHGESSMSVEGPSPQVFVVDDDEAILRTVTRILRRAGYAVETFSTPRDFLSRAQVAPPCCVLLDVQMPGMTGLDLQAELSKFDVPPPVVFMSGYLHVPTSVQAMKAGAVDFLPKPFRNDELLAAVANALRRSTEQSALRARTRAARDRLARLTPREREVFDRLVRGLRSKEIAEELGAAVKTVNVHRGRVMSKLGASSVAELVRLAAQAEEGGP